MPHVTRGEQAGHLVCHLHIVAALWPAGLFHQPLGLRRGCGQVPALLVDVGATPDAVDILRGVPVAVRAGGVHGHAQHVLALAVADVGQAVHQLGAALALGHADDVQAAAELNHVVGLQVLPACGHVANRLGYGVEHQFPAYCLGDGVERLVERLIVPAHADEVLGADNQPREAHADGGHLHLNKVVVGRVQAGGRQRFARRHGDRVGTGHQGGA